MDNFNVGDRVRYAVTNRVGIVINVDPPLLYVRFGIDDNAWLNPKQTTLVERAWYAEPGVTMVAMTPERIAVLEAIVRGMYDKFPARPLNGRVLEGIIAEAHGEVSRG